MSKLDKKAAVIAVATFVCLSGLNTCIKQSTKRSIQQRLRFSSDTVVYNSTQERIADICTEMLDIEEEGMLFDKVARSSYFNLKHELEDSILATLAREPEYSDAPTAELLAIDELRSAHICELFCDREIADSMKTRVSYFYGAYNYAE